MATKTGSLAFRPFFRTAGLLAVGALLLGTARADAQVATSWIPGNGTWPNGAKWTNGVPNSANADVYIDSQSGTNSIVTLSSGVPSVGYGVTLGRLRIDTGDRVELGDGSTGLNMDSSAFAGAGEILLNGTLYLPGSSDGGLSNQLTGTKFLNGTGKLLLGQPGRHPEILGNTTNNVTIEGTAFFGRSNSGGNAFPIFNNGLVNANITGEALQFATFGATNSSTMKATNGGLLRFVQGDMNNAGGLITADGIGSSVNTTIVDFGGRFVTSGGNLTASNGGLLRINGEATWKNLTSSGPTQMTGVLTLDGTVTNNGVMTVSGAQNQIISPANPSYDPALTVTLAGSGEVILDKAPNGLDPAFGGAASKWLIQNQTIRGRGSVRASSSSAAPEVTNRGIFQADRNGEAMELLLRNLDNQSGGILRAQDSGILQLGIQNTVQNNGGTIEALSGGKIVSSFGRIHGGLIWNHGGSINLNGMTLFNPGTGMTLRGELTVASNETMRLVNEITNEGTLRIQSNGNDATVFLGEDAAPNVTLTGNGVVKGDVKLGDVLNGFTGTANLVERFGGATFTIADDLIHGFGNLGSGNRQLTVVNRDTVTADAAGRALNVRVGAFNNTQGALRAENGGILQLSSNTPIANGGSLIGARANSTVQFETATEVSGGTLRNVNATFNLNNGTFDLSNATLFGPGIGLTSQGAFIVRNAAAARLVGTIRNEGKIQLRSSGNDTTLFIGRAGEPNASLTGGGDIILGDATLGATFSRLDAGDADAFLSLDAQTLRGFGVVGFGFGSSQRFLRLTNNSLINADVNGRTLALVPTTLTNSPGSVMKATSGGSLYFNPFGITNTGASIQATTSGGPSTVIFDATSIAGGSVNSEAPTTPNNFTTGGTIQILNDLTASGGIIFANAGRTIIGGGNGGTQTFTGQNNGGSTFINGGNVTKVGSGDYSMFTSLNNTGSMILGTGAGVLRWFGGGMIAQAPNASFSAALGTDLTFQGAVPFAFSGTNVLDGVGNHWMACPITLADAADVTVSNLNLQSASVTGPGSPTVKPTLKISSNVRFHPSTISLSGLKLINLAGSTGLVDLGGAPALTFTNNAQWENSGTVTMSGYINTIEGAPGTLFTNTSSGILRGGNAQTNDFAMPFLNENGGTIDVTGGILHLKKSGTFKNGAATIANGTQLYLENSVLTLEGQANTSRGLGFFQMVGNSSLALTPSSKLSADNLQFNNSSSAAGTGVVDVAKDLRFHPYSAPSIMDGVRFNAAATSIGLIQFDGGLLRFQMGASLRNAGNMEIRASSALELNTGALFENSGLLRIYDSPTFGGDNSGLFRTLGNSETRFYASRTVSWPFDFAGQLFAENGAVVTFDKGGLFNRTAKIWPNHPASQITFTGATPYRTRGQAVEFPGTGYVNFVNTSLQFEADPATPGVESTIAAGARVAFHGDNTVSGPGTLTTTGFVFQSGNQIINGTTLQTFGTADVSLWNAVGGSLELKNGARFLNNARFVIPFQVGAPGAPGIKGDPGTLFHNMANGRLVHDSNATTEFNIDFRNEGFLEFIKGTVNFLKTYSGNGGVAVSGGAVIDLGTTPFTDPNNLPRGLQASGAGSSLKMTFASGQVYNVTNPDAVKAAAAGKVNLAGAARIAVTGPGTINAVGAGSIVRSNGADLIGNDGGTLIGNDGGTLVGNDGASLIGNDGGTLIGNDGGTLIGNDGGSLIGNDGGSLVAAGGGNLVAAGAGNLVAAGGGNNLGSSFDAPARPKQRAPRRSLDELTGTRGLDALMAKVDALSINPRAGRIFVDTGANARVGTGSIIAEMGGIIAGAGTFTGPGLIKNGGTLLPGSTVGTLTWNGNLNVQSGGLLEIEIGGTTAGTQYDVVNVSGTCTMNGALSVRFLNGFGGGVQPAATFDVVKAAGGITTNLAGSRVSIFGSTGTFLVQLADSGKTLRLTDFQPGAVTFSNWAASYGLTGANAALTADPNRNGLSNLLEYALGLDPTAVGGPRGISSGLVEAAGQKYLSLSYTKPTGSEARPDIVYTPERATAVLPNAWSSADIVPVGTAPGPGSLETVTVRSTHPLASGNSREFLRLSVTLTTP